MAMLVSEHLKQIGLNPATRKNKYIFLQNDTSDEMDHTVNLTKEIGASNEYVKNAYMTLNLLKHRKVCFDEEYNLKELINQLKQLKKIAIHNDAARLTVSQETITGAHSGSDDSLAMTFIMTCAEIVNIMDTAIYIERTQANNNVLKQANNFSH
jgi:hypothetical protein